MNKEELEKLIETNIFKEGLTLDRDLSKDIYKDKKQVEKKK